MLQWLITFPEFAKFTDFLIHLEKTPLYPRPLILCLKFYPSNGDIFLNWYEFPNTISHYFYLEKYLTFMTERAKSSMFTGFLLVIVNQI